jgi:DNA helicase-2/ATP-dependent DNA helicase PcrA
VLDAANAVAVPLRAGPATVQLRPAQTAGAGELAIARTHTVEDEARWLAARMRAAWDAMPPGARTAAVLVRRRAQLPLLAEALQAQRLPIEVVGLGGLLTTPEVVDVVATLRVLIRHDLGTALARLLTGARWRIGARDLAALRDRASWLARAPDGSTDEGLSLVEALDDPGPPERYSAEGYRRLVALADELRRLRRRTGAPLPELVADVERTMGIDIEVAARPDRARIGRVHLDRFLDVAADFAAEADEATLSAFLAFLEAAEDEENGLEAGEIVVDAERVQLLTVHGAKGLEWDVVAVPGLVRGVFPADPRSVNWARARQELPAPLRGDRTDLPALELAAAHTRKDVRDLLKEHDQDVKRRHADEERRLGYVALTRAKSLLLASSYVWDLTQKSRETSPFLDEIAGFTTPDEWCEPGPDETNPLTEQARASMWPLDPLGPFPGDDGPGRRPDVEHGAALVRAAAQRPPLGIGTQAEQWRADVDRLLAERARLDRAGSVEVELPQHLSVSQLVELERDPVELARSIRRPLPRRPAPWARRGTQFHRWLEERWQAQTLLDLDQLPGAADETAVDEDFAALREAFLASEWATRTPAEVEVPFEMALAGDRVVRGRMDAVFGNADDGWAVVDWKTGRKPSGAAAEAAAIQLAAYRLAWARLCGLPDTEISRVRAAFHYVRSNETVEPARLLDADGLRDLLA